LFLALTVLLGCTGSPESATPPPTASGGFDALDRASTTHADPLHLRDGEYALTAPTLGDKIDLEAVGTWTLEHEAIPNPKKAARILKAIRAPLPFDLSKEDQRFRPVGMEILVDGEVIPFSRATVGKARNPTWRINGRAVVISYPTMPRPGAVQVRWPAVPAALERHDPQSMDDPAAFARYELTLAGETRHGLMLPAPASAAYTVTVPAEAARFETFLALEPSPLSFPKTNGAEAVLLVRSGSGEEEAGRLPITPKLEGYQRWEVDLSKWAGQEVTLSLVSDPGKNAHPHFDWLFWGSPTVSGAPSGAPRRVVVIAFDTFRPDHLGLNGEPRGLTPELDAIGRQSARFIKSWTPAPRTRPSFRSATTGRLPLDAVGATNVGEVFQAAGFATAGIVANIHLQPRFDFDNGFDWWWFRGDLDAQVQVDAALSWLDDNEHRDTFLFVHFMDPHLPYNAPGAFRDRFVEAPAADFPARANRWDVLKWQREGTLKEDWKAQLEGMYSGELASMDQEIGRFIRGIDALDGASVVVIHNDHGEEFWDHGGFEHNHTLYDEVTRAMIWFRPKGGLSSEHVVRAPASLIDIGPTLFDLAGLTPPEVDGVSLRTRLTTADDVWDRPIPVGYLQYSHERWGVVWEDKKYILHTASGREELYDLAADPGEHTDLAPTTDTASFRPRLAEAHKLSEDHFGAGLRLFVALEAGDPPVIVTLPTPARGAGVLDPEAGREHRANLEWGETAKLLPDEVGAVSLSDDGLTVTFTPGTEPSGIVWIRADGASTDGVSVSVGGSPRTLSAVEPTGMGWSEGERNVRLASGTILVPPPGEQARIVALRDGVDVAGASADERAALELLGYIGNE
jgi:arylsulfatase A-like enzyme